MYYLILVTVTLIEKVENLLAYFESYRHFRLVATTTYDNFLASSSIQSTPALTCLIPLEAVPELCLSTRYQLLSPLAY